MASEAQSNLPTTETVLLTAQHDQQVTLTLTNIQSISETIKVNDTFIDDNVLLAEGSSANLNTRVLAINLKTGDVLKGIASASGITYEIH